MPTYFAGSGLDAFDYSPALSTHVAGGINLTGNEAAWAEATVYDPATGLPFGVSRLWTHCRIATNGGVAPGNRPFAWYNDAGLLVFEGVGVLGSIIAFRYWNGAEMVSFVDFPAQASGILDLLIVTHATQGRLALFWNGQIVKDETGIDTSSMGLIERFRMAPTTGNGYQERYDVILASYNTIGHTVRTRSPTGAGALAGWTGSYLDIDDTDIDDTNALNTSTSDAVSTFTAASLPAPSTGNVIKAVTVAARIRNDGGEVPRNARAVLRIAGTNYPRTANMRISAGYVGSVAVFDTDPSTGQPWASIDNVNSEFGLQAVD